MPAAERAPDSSSKRCELTHYFQRDPKGTLASSNSGNSSEQSDVHFGAVARSLCSYGAADRAL